MYIPEHRQNRFAMRAVINYCQQEYKTFDSKSKRRLVGGVNCDGENAFREFMATKKVLGIGIGKIVNAAASGQEEITEPELDFEQEEYKINSVGFESGMKLRQSPSTLKKLRKLSDEICIAHRLSVLQPYKGGGKRMSTREYSARMKGESWKQKLANDIDKAMEFSGSRDEFIRSMSILGYHMTWTDTRKNITFHCPNGKKCCDDKLHDDKYLKENIERELHQREFPGGEKQPTGWEDSRELYEQHLKERAQSKAETQKIADSYSNVSSEISSFAGAVSKIVDNDTEDPDERRKRIEAEENGEALGTVLGIGIGKIVNAAASGQEEITEPELDFEQEEYKNL